MKTSAYFLFTFVLYASTCHLRAQVTQVNHSYSFASYGIPALAHVNGAGTDRLLVFIAANEYETPPNVQITNIEYGGQPMTLAGNEEIYTGAGNCWAEIEVYYLLEAGIQAAVGNNFTVTYSHPNTNLRAIKHSAITYEGVDQTNPIGQVESNTIINNNTIQTLPLSGNGNDLLMSIASGGHTGSYSMGGGFTTIYNQNGNTHTYGSFDRLFQTNCSQITPVINATNNMNRQSMVSLVLQSIIQLPDTIDVLPNDTALCDGDVLLLDATTAGATYLWQDASTNATYNITTAGQYWVEVDINGCKRYDTINVTYAPLPVVNLGNDTALCEGDNLLLDVTTGAATYTWQDGSTNATYNATQAGIYWVDVNNNGCIARDSIVITYTNGAIDLGNDTALCDGDLLQLDATTGGATYLWQDASTNPTFDVTNTGQYWVLITLNGCDFRDTINVAYNPYPIIDLGPDVTICEGDNSILDATTTNATYQWQDQTATATYTAYQQGTYWVDVTVAGCTSRDSIEVLHFMTPEPLISATETQGCEPFTTTFSNATTNVVCVECIWSLGDGTEVNSCDPFTHTYEYAGQYDVTLTVTSSDGCTVTNTFDSYITVHQNPIAMFYADPQPATILNTNIQMLDISEGAVSQWQWTFYHNDGSTVIGEANEQNPWFAFPQDTGAFAVNMEVTTVHGCKDDTTIDVLIEGIYNIYVPSAFSPNGDGHNDLFFPQGIGTHPTNFNFSIYNRWGELIWKSGQFGEGWDGIAKEKSGRQIVQEGMYVWKIYAEEVLLGGKTLKHEYMGHVTLVR